MNPIDLQATVEALIKTLCNVALPAAVVVVAVYIINVVLTVVRFG
jgi:hypothetical protein